MNAASHSSFSKTRVLIGSDLDTRSNRFSRIETSLANTSRMGDALTHNGTSRTVVLIGCTAMGLASIRRLTNGKHLILAHYAQPTLTKTITTLRDEGFSVTGYLLEIASFSSVECLATLASRSGPIDAIIHTAGLCPMMGTAKEILDINLIGTANVIDAFLPVAGPGTSLVVLASTAAYMGQLSHELETHLATAPRSELLSHPEIDLDSDYAAQIGYMTSKRGNVLRVQAAAQAWGRKGARINSVSPGVISTPMGRRESSEVGLVTNMIAASAAGRMGTPEELANAIAFVAGPESSFMTGTDLLVDGGFLAADRWNRKEMSNGA